MKEYDNGSTYATVEYIRGHEMGGGIGGILYSNRGGALSFDHYNIRGDVVATTEASGAKTWQGWYDAFGTHTHEKGTAPQDRQRANTKDEDPTGLLNEGFRYRDLETGSFITADPLGFKAGPNFYTYVNQNPWTTFDPEGLDEAEDAARKAAEAQAKAAAQASAKMAKLYRVTGNPNDPKSAKIHLMTPNEIKAIRGKGANIWINGMLNDDEHAAQLGLNHTKQKEFYMIHNPTEGFGGDLAESSASKALLQSKIATSTAEIMKNFDLTKSTVTAHSQGSLILNDAMSRLHAEGVDMKGMQIAYHGAAANSLLSRVRAHNVGATVTEFRGQPLDPVHNIVGLNTINPLRIVGSVAMGSWMMFMDRNSSPHSFVEGGSKIPGFLTDRNPLLRY